MQFKAILVEKTDAGQSVALKELGTDALMEGDVLVRVSHSTVNYKDGLALTGKSPVVRRFPMIPGIDLSGVVETSSHADWRAGDAVILNGWGLGETHFGGYAGYARVKGEWLVRFAEELHPRACDGDRHGRIHGDALRAGARKARASRPPTGRSWSRALPAASVRSRSRFSPSSAGTSSPRPAGARRTDYLEGPRRGGNHRSQGALGKGPPSGQGAMGRRRRQRRLAHARKCPVDDQIRRRGRRLRSCTGHGFADLRRALHPAGRRASRCRQRDGEKVPPASKPGSAWRATSTSRSSMR